MLHHPYFRNKSNIETYANKKNVDAKKKFDDNGNELIYDGYQWTINTAILNKKYKEK